MSVELEDWKISNKMRLHVHSFAAPTLMNKVLKKVVITMITSVNAMSTSVVFFTILKLQTRQIKKVTSYSQITLAATWIILWVCSSLIHSSARICIWEIVLIQPRPMGSSMLDCKMVTNAMVETRNHQMEEFLTVNATTVVTETEAIHVVVRTLTLSGMLKNTMVMNYLTNLFVRTKCMSQLTALIKVVIIHMTYAWQLVIVRQEFMKRKHVVCNVLITIS